MLQGGPQSFLEEVQAKKGQIFFIRVADQKETYYCWSNNNNKSLKHKMVMIASMLAYTAKAAHEWKLSVLPCYGMTEERGGVRPIQPDQPSKRRWSIWQFIRLMLLVLLNIMC